MDVIATTLKTEAEKRKSGEQRRQQTVAPSRIEVNYLDINIINRKIVKVLMGDFR